MQAIAPLCRVVLLDLSRPSDSICWELETVSALGSSIVLLIENSKLEYLQENNKDEDDGEASVWARLGQTARGLPLIVYETPECIGETRLMHILEKELGSV